MGAACRSALLSCLLFASLVRANDGDEIALDQLPREAANLARDFFAGGELLRARRLVTDGKECYIVSGTGRGQLVEAYVAPDGRMIARKGEPISSAQLVAQLTDFVLFPLLPGVVAGAVARWLAQSARGEKLSVLSEWAWAWAGAGITIGLVLLNLATVPRHKDLLIIAALCAVWGAVSASLVEILGLTAQLLRGYRVGCRRWILGCCVAAFASLALHVPVDALRVERENQYYMGLAMRPATD
jgi:hypothetical protein